MIVEGMKLETVTLVLVNLANILERADESLLPGVYREVGLALHANPTQLGSLTLYRSIVQTSCYPLATYLAVSHNRTHVIALGAFLWAGATFLVAISSTFTEVAVARGLNGIGLAIFAPAIKSLVADSTDDSNRGTAFGWLSLTGGLGSIIGGFISVLMAPTSFMGIPGWRLVFHLVGILSVVIGVLVRLFAKDPRFFHSDGTTKEQTPSKPFKEEVKELVKESKAVIKVPSFQVLAAQGVFGAFLWTSMSFAPMWLELMGLSHKTTAVIFTMYNVATSLGACFGGWLGDFLAKRLPNVGRIILAQISTGSAIPLAAILLLGLPNGPSASVMHGLVIFVMGLVISWNGPATNNPIFAEIVPERARTIIYALDRFFESILASFSPPVVGILAQHVYGYKPIAEGSTNSKMIETDRENAASLGKALYTTIGIPMAICCLIYSYLYCTYPRDRDRARMDALIESEMQQIEEENSTAIEEYSLLHVSVHADESVKERSVTEIDYGANGSFNFDENDEQKLLSLGSAFSDAVSKS